ncbi:hypothetical protein GCM10014715_84050 [Streptomyces spiralis]|uniref:Uncharacterized protein n=1 Tax=Streptomyces spiralis TaxID=66376 RepID=A0A919ALT1_9ACTN|nr:hypothetical protein GCM10014715_84050 [Streptomyces spiralis]
MLDPEGHTGSCSSVTNDTSGRSGEAAPGGKSDYLTHDFDGDLDGRNNLENTAVSRWSHTSAP